VPVYGDGHALVPCRRSLERTYVADPGGADLALLKILARGEHDVDRLPAALGALGHVATGDDISRMVRQLDEWGVLERADSTDKPDPATRQSHASNLRDYDLFSTLSRSSADMHLAAADCTVLLLGAGGLGSGILQSLVGLGVGRVTLVDPDVVEIKNLARQFVYSPGDVGRPKVIAAARWVSAYSAETTVPP
jgi:molybdopterin/thiamine biosynthesis adenylyltransferase